jgi:hypothetical protein
MTIGLYWYIGNLDICATWLFGQFGYMAHGLLGYLAILLCDL